MPTIKQKKLAQELVNNLQKPIPDTAGQILEKIGYSKGIQKSPSQVIDTPGVKKALEDLGFTEEFAKKKVVEIMQTSENEMAVLKGAEQIFKVHGSYAAEKHTNLNVNLGVTHDPKTQAIADEYEEKLKQSLLGKYEEANGSN